jgi:hypothetical protein
MILCVVSYRVAQRKRVEIQGLELAKTFDRAFVQLLCSSEIGLYCYLLNIMLKVMSNCIKDLVERV